MKNKEIFFWDEKDDLDDLSGINFEFESDIVSDNDSDLFAGSDLEYDM